MNKCEVEPNYSPSFRHFGTRIRGPELKIQDILATQLKCLFSSNNNPYWAASSLSLGAGMPDIMFASYKPEVSAGQNIKISDTQILAYLRLVSCAKTETIAHRVGKNIRNIEQRLDYLCNSNIINMISNNIFSLSKEWRHILPKVISVEVKVSNWKAAIRQASRNKIFSHFSYVAFPSKLATRVMNENIFDATGIGIIGISEKDIKNAFIVKRAKKIKPVVWTYYYQLASILSKDCK